MSAQSGLAKVPLTVEEQAWIAEHPTITAGNNTAYPPFDFVSAGEPVGLSIDYLNLLTSKVGLNVEYINYGSLSENLKMGMEQKLDVIHTLVENEERQKYFTFSDPFTSDDVVLYGRVGEERIRNINDLKDKKIGFIKGHALLTTYQQQYPDLHYVEFNTNMEVLRALASNEIDVYPYETSPIKFHISQNNLQGIEIVGDDFIMENSKINHRIAVHNNNPILMSILNKSMAAVTSKEFETITDKWLPSIDEFANIGLTPEEKYWLSQNRVIKVGVDPAAAPNEAIDENGNISGISGDYLDIIAAKLNIKFEWAGSRTWSEALSMIKTGEADVLSSAVPNSARREYLLFTDIYIASPNFIFTRNVGQVFGDLNSLSGYKIAQIKDFSVNELIRTNYPEIEIIEVANSGDAMQKVSSGEGDAFIGSIPGGVSAITKQGMTNIIVSGTVTEFQVGNAIATRKNLPLLAGALQKALGSITTVQREEITRRWQSVQVAAAPNYTLLRQLGLLALVIIVAISIWAVSAQFEIRRRRVVERKLVLSQKNAEKANAEKSTFLANMSHELRTPLNAIIGFSEAITSEIYGKIENQKYREYIRDIHNSGQHLETVINDILDLSKIDAGKWNLDESKFNLETCINSAYKIIELQAADKNITVNLTGLATESSLNIYGDETAYKRILINLLSNSVKFTDNGGSIAVNVTLLANSDLKLETIDNGIGIPADKMEHVLTPFSQAHDTKTSNKIGTGLGLPIVKKLAELHGGSFSLCSKENVNTVATVIIPAYRVFTKNI